ncbi:MAG: hypothetical protein KGZ58_00825 [Ignavibacteriales bacterium]|nr:hypothetical protein [Ignavibacteriales bacterium]
MNTVKEQLHNVIEKLSDAEANTILKLVENVHRKETLDDSLQSLRSSSIKIPNTSSQKFHYVEPASALGKSASQQLIEDRR